MALDISLILGIAGVFILSGYVSDYIFRRFGFPDIIILLAIGVLIGPASGLVKRSDMIEFAPILAALVMTILLYNGGLKMTYDRVIRGSGRSIILAGTAFALTVIATMLVTMPMLGWDPLTGLLLGVILGGMTSAVVVPLAKKVSSNQRIPALLELESSYTDVMVILASIAVILFIAFQANPSALTFGFGAGGLTVAIPIGIAIGIGGGFAWSRMMISMRSAYEDVITLAIAFALYGLAEYVGGSGPIAALAFGITFGNAPGLIRSLRNELPLVKDSEIEVSARKFESQIAFMVRAILFILLGSLLAMSGTGMVLAGIVIALVLFFPRMGATWITSQGDRELRRNAWLISFMLPRGLAVGTAALLPTLFKLDNASTFINLAFVVIVSTVAITTIGVSSLRLSKAVMMPAQKGVAGGSVAETDALRKTMIFVAIAFAAAAGSMIAVNSSTGGQLFGVQFAFEKGDIQELSIKPLGEPRAYFFDGTGAERSLTKQYGPSKVVSYRWDFGDGTTSKEPQVVHMYGSTGEFVVKFTIVREDSVAHSGSTVLKVSE